MAPNNQKVFKNSGLLFIRLAFTLIITLYTSRIILGELGVEDYGIFNVVGSTVGLFSFISISLTNSAQRHFSYEFGKENYDRLSKLFSMSLNIHIVFSILIFISIEVIGFWLFTNLNIPIDRVFAAKWVFHLSVFNACVQLALVPYYALVIASERFSVVAILSIIEALFILVISVAVFELFNIDSLILYGVVLAIISILTKLSYAIYAIKKVKKVNYVFRGSKKDFKFLMSFLSWNLFGGIAFVAMNQGVNILLNLFFGPSINAARAIAFQVQTAVLQFSSNAQLAINPQITKTIATGDSTRRNTLMLNGTKYLYFLLLLLVTPIFIDSNSKSSLKI